MMRSSTSESGGESGYTTSSIDGNEGLPSRGNCRFEDGYLDEDPDVSTVEDMLEGAPLSKPRRFRGDR